jgi:hypothetical protein
MLIMILALAGLPLLTTTNNMEDNELTGGLITLITLFY